MVLPGRHSCPPIPFSRPSRLHKRTPFSSRRPGCDGDGDKKLFYMSFSPLPFSYHIKPSFVNISIQKKGLYINKEKESKRSSGLYRVVFLICPASPGRRRLDMGTPSASYLRREKQLRRAGNQGWDFAKTGGRAKRNLPRKSWRAKKRRQGAQQAPAETLPRLRTA